MSLVVFTASEFVCGEEKGPAEAEAQPKPQREGDDAAESAEAKQQRERAEQRETRQERMEARLFEGIELTAEQREEVVAIRDDIQQRVTAWREEHKEQLTALRERMQDARRHDDSDAAQSAMEELRSLMVDAPRPTEFHDRVRELLTDAQRPVYDENLTDFRAWLRERRGQRSDGADRDASQGADKPEAKKGDPEKEPVESKPAETKPADTKAADTKQPAPADAGTDG